MFTIIFSAVLHTFHQKIFFICQVGGSVCPGLGHFWLYGFFLSWPLKLYGFRTLVIFVDFNPKNPTFLLEIDFLMQPSYLTLYYTPFHKKSRMHLTSSGSQRSKCVNFRNSQKVILINM